MAVKITGVQPGSLASRAGILPGDILISIGGEAINDVLDYRFFMADEKLSLKLTRNETPVSVSITKGEYDDLGLLFETYLILKSLAKRLCLKILCSSSIFI